MFAVRKFWFLVAIILLCSLASPQQRKITPEIALQWEVLRTGSLAPDASHFVAEVDTVAGDHRLLYGPVGTAEPYRIDGAFGAKWSDDSLWLLYQSPEGFHLQNLNGNPPTTFAQATSAEFIDGQLVSLVPASGILTITALGTGKQTRYSGARQMVISPSRDRVLAVFERATSDFELLMLKPGAAPLTLWSGPRKPIDIVAGNKGVCIQQPGSITYSSYEGGTKRVLGNGNPKLPQGLSVRDDKVQFDIDERGVLFTVGEPESPLSPKIESSLLRRPREFRSLWVLDDNRIEVLETAELTDPLVIQGGKHAILRHVDGDLTPRQQREGLQQWRLLDIADGTTTSVSAQSPWGISVSPAYNATLTYDKGLWTFHMLPSGKAIILQSLQCASATYDGPRAERPPAAEPVWSPDGTHVAISNGSEVILVNQQGAIVSRLSAKPGLGASIATVSRTGTALIERRGEGKSELAELSPKGAKVLLQSNGWISKSQFFGDTVLCAMQSWNSSPALHIVKDGKAEPLFALNQDQASYAWPESSVFSYTNDGVSLNCGLIAPAGGFTDATRLVVIVYDKLADSAFKYGYPDAYDPVSPNMLAQSGFAVLLPDVRFKVGDPGMSSVSCLKSALAELKKRVPSLNQKEIGIVGHSWGGYQALFAATQIPSIKVVVSGAPISDLTALYYSKHESSGLDNAAILEFDQGRMGKSPSEIPANYVRNSPITFLERSNADFLIVVGSEDFDVGRNQANLAFHKLKALGKPAYMLTYAGSGHGIRDNASIRDYAKKTREFLATSLLGQKRPQWME